MRYKPLALRARMNLFRFCFLDIYPAVGALGIPKGFQAEGKRWKAAPGPDWVSRLYARFPRCWKGARSGSNVRNSTLPCLQCVPRLPINPICTLYRSLVTERLPPKK